MITLEGHLVGAIPKSIRKCPKCKLSMDVVKYSSGGYVKQACSSCGEHQPFTEKDFEELNLTVKCISCGQAMRPGLYRKNYAYNCLSCDKHVELAVFLPKYEDIIPNK